MALHVGRDKFKQMCEDVSLTFPESPLHHKIFPPNEPVLQKTEAPPPKWPPPGEPCPDQEVFMKRLALHQVLLQNTYKAHKRSGTHYQYSRFYLRDQRGLKKQLLQSPRFFRRAWVEDPDARRPVWIDHENYAPFSVATYSIHALESEAKKLLAWAAAVVPHSIPADPETGELWPARTPPNSVCKPPVTARARVERIHHKVI
ncbi:hypothetical protein B0H14DRAFT_3174899 [Mycena olivaceomarginata]|nr:hypothetical protein B0H14DRAFT_3174899 [Mycena olivaceomarginata]